MPSDLTPALAASPLFTGRLLSQALLALAGMGTVVLLLLYLLKRQVFYAICTPVAKFTQGSKVRSCAAVLTVLVSGYYTVRKAFGWSVSETLNTIFHTSAATTVSFFLLALVVVGIAINGINLWLDHNPIEAAQKIEPESLSKCILRINNEIQRHCLKIHEVDATNVRNRLIDGHSFEENIGLVVDSLVEHAVDSIKGFKVRRRDLFISVYTVPNFQDLSAERNELLYLTHFPPNRDNIGTRKITLTDPQRQDFACVRCIQAGQEFISSLDCADYARGSGKRHKTVKHYFGFAIKTNDRLLGFINIEFHNEQFFVSQEQLDAYAERHLIMFKYLMSYQFLKAVFFHELKRHLPENNPLPAKS